MVIAPPITWPKSQAYHADQVPTTWELVRFALWDVWWLYCGGYRRAHVLQAYAAWEYGPYWRYHPAAQARWPGLCGSSFS